MSTNPAPLPPVIYGTFSGPINQDTVQRIINGVTSIMGAVKHLHVLFNSSGGFIGDGICLYNFFRALTIDLTLYNGGSVASIATVAFLGAKFRKTSRHGTFMIHRAHNSPQHATASKLEDIARSLRIDDARIEAILRDHIKLEEKQWKDLNYEELTFNAEDGVKIGFAHGIEEFAPPAGSKIFAV
jgi:ATP-dependent Clp protease protease subunit